MKIYVYLPDDLENSETIEDVIDANFDDDNDYIEYVSDPSEFANYAKNDEYQGLVVFVDSSKKGSYHPIQLLQKVQLKGPILSLYQNKDTRTLFNLANYGVVSALEFDSSELKNGTLRTFMENARLGFLGRTAVEAFGPLEMDFNLKQAKVNGDDLKLTTKEYSMLEALVKNKGNLRTKDQLVSALYGVTDDVPEIKIIDVFICKMRDKLNKKLPGLGESIETVWGRGYSFNPQISMNSKNTKKFGELHIDLENTAVSIEGNVIDLTVTEFMILRRFALNYPEQVSVEELVKEASKFGRSADADTVSRGVYAISRKFEEYGAQYRSFISNIRGSSMYTLNLMGIDESAARKLKYDIVQMPPFALNRTLSRAYFKNQDLELTAAEYDLLNIFMEGFPNYLELDAIVARLHGEGERTAAAVNQTLIKLRHKIKEANGGEDMIVSRRSIGYKLDIKTKRVLAKVADKRDVQEIGPWHIDAGNYEITYKSASMNEDAPGDLLTLSRKQFDMMQALLQNFPNAMTREALYRAVYGEENTEGAESGSKLDVLFSLLKTSLSKQLTSFDGQLRKVGQELFRVDMDYDNIPQHILDVCDVEEVGPWGVNRTLNMAMFDGDPLSLKDKEVEAMDLFIQEYPQPVSTKALADRLTNGNAASLNTVLTSLRKNIAASDVLDNVLINRRGVGYLLQVNFDELTDDQQDNFRTSAIGNYVLNHDTGMLVDSTDEKSISVQINAVEIAVLECLMEASKPLSTEEMRIAIQDAGHDVDAAYTKQCLYILGRKCDEAGFKNGDLHQGSGAIGYYLAYREDEIRKNSSFTDIDNIRINDTLRELSVFNATISLTGSEYTLLSALAANPKVPLSNQDISRLSEEGDRKFSESTFNLTKGKIVRKLEAAGLHKDFLQVFGYQQNVGHYFKSREGDLDRSRAQGKRASSLKSDDVTVRCGELSINTITDRVEFEGAHLEAVSGKPLDLLTLMAKNHGRAVTIEEIAQHFFGDKSDKHVTQAQRGVVGLRHMLNRSITGLGDEIIRDVPGAGCALIFNNEEYAAVYNSAREAGLLSQPKKAKPAKKAVEAAPAQKAAAKKPAENGADNSGTTDAPQSTGSSVRKSFTDRYASFGR